MNKVADSKDVPRRLIVYGLSEQQADLLTRLGREAVPIFQAREYAARELDLEARRDALEEQVMLARPFLANQVSPEYERLKRQLVTLMLRLDMKVLEDLRAGTLLAFGVRLPLRPSTVPAPIPPGLWYLMSFNMEDCTAAGQHWSYRDVTVINVRSMGAPERRAIDRGLSILAAKMEAEASAMAAPPPADETQPLSPRGSAAGSSPDNPVYVALAKVDERLVFKTEGLRHNTRYGKVTPVAAAPNEKETAEEDMSGVSVAGDEALAGSDATVRIAQDDVASLQDEPVRTPTYGPWSVMPQIEDELRRRAATTPKLCKPTWREESTYLWHWARKKFKRDEATKTGDPPGLKWIRETLGKLYYELNPESPHPRRPRQKSKTPAKSPAKR